MTPPHITKRQHHLIVAGGMVACGVAFVLWPEHNHYTTPVAVLVNLFWLLVEPTA